MAAIYRGPRASTAPSSLCYFSINTNPPNLSRSSRRPPVAPTSPISPPLHLQTIPSFLPPPRTRTIHPLHSSPPHTHAKKEAATMATAAADDVETKNDLVLLDFWVSPFGQRCRIALAEKGIPYDYSEQDLLGTKSDLLLKSNPIHKKIPVLLHAGRPICESLVILSSLDDAFPSPTSSSRDLLPSDPYARAQARFWAAYTDKIYEAGTRVWKLKGDARAQARDELVQVLRNLDGELGDKEFFGGEGFGFVDVAAVPFVEWLPSYERYGEFAVEEVAPRVAAWGRRCAQRESVAKSLHPPEKVDEFISLLKKIFGIE